MVEDGRKKKTIPLGSGRGCVLRNKCSLRRRWAKEKMCSQGKDGTEERMWPRGEDGLGEGSLRRKWGGGKDVV
jgi:hypothetical protein